MMRTMLATRTAGAQPGSGSESEQTAAWAGGSLPRFLVEPRFTFGMVTRMTGQDDKADVRCRLARRLS